MRSTLAWIAVLILGGVGVFWWQRSEIVRLREQVAIQGSALADNKKRVEDLSLLVIREGRRGMDAYGSSAASARAGGLRRPDDGAAALRADERRVILDQYRDVLAQMNLSPETASRLQDMLTDRIETVLDAEDAAVRAGFAEGSAETVRAVGFAVADVDREIASLVGPFNNRLLNGIPATPEPAPVYIPEPSAAPAIVTVVVQAPAQPYYSDEPAPVAAGYPPYLAYSPYSYYLPPAVFVGRGGVRPFVGIRNGVERPQRPSFGGRSPRVEPASRGRL